MTQFTGSVSFLKRTFIDQFTRRQNNSPFSYSYRRSFQRGQPQNNANLNGRNQILQSIENAATSLGDRELYSSVLNNSEQNERRIDFLPPQDVNSTELPPPLEKYYDIQKTFFNYDANDEKQTEKLVNFIEENVHLGLRELEIHIFIRPKLVKSYVYLYTLLSRNLRIIATQNLTVSPEFSNYLNKTGNWMTVESAILKQGIFSERNYLPLITDTLFSVPNNNSNYTKLSEDMISAIVDDNVDFFHELTTKPEFKFDTIYLYGSRRCCTLMQLFALYGSINCFKFFISNNVNFKNEVICFAVAGGNFEIISILRQAGENFADFAMVALLYRQDQVYDWIVSNYWSETLLNEKLSLFILTETMSIKSIYSLCLKNKDFFVNANDLLVLASSDGLFEITRVLSQFSVFSIDLFFLSCDEDTINHFLDSCQLDVLQKLYDYAYRNGYLNHLRLILTHPKFGHTKMTTNDLVNLKKDYSDLYQVLIEQSNKITDVNDIYERYKNGFPLSAVSAMKVMKQCLSMNDFQLCFDILSKYKADFEKKDLIEALQMSPFIWPHIVDILLSQALTDEDKMMITRYCYIDNIVRTKAYQTEVMKDLSFLSLLSPVDCVNLVLLSRTTKVFQHLIDRGLLPQTYAKFIMMTQSGLYSQQRAAEIVTEMLNTEAFKLYINGHEDEKRLIVHNFSNLLKRQNFLPHTKENFEYCLKFYIYLANSTKPLENQQGFTKQNFRQQNENFQDPETSHMLLQFLQDDKNRQYLDIKELSKSQLNLPLLRHIEYTKEEFDYIRTVDFMSKYLFSNRKNTKHLKIPEIFKFLDNSNVDMALSYLPATEENVNELLKQEGFHSHKEKILLRKEFRQILPTNFLIKSLSGEYNASELPSAIVNEIMSRTLDREQDLNFAMRVPLNQQICKNILAQKQKFSKDFLIIFSIRAGIPNVIQSTTKFDDFYFINLIKMNFNISKFSTKMFEYNISPVALTNALLLLIKNRDSTNAHILVRKGAKLNAIVNGVSPFKKSFNYIPDKIPVFISEGANIGYQQNTALYYAMTNCSPEVQKVILGRTNVNEEVRYYNPTVFKLAKYEFSHRLDIIYRFNQVADSLQTKFDIKGLSEINAALLSSMINSNEMEEALFCLLHFTNRFNSIVKPLNLNIIYSDEDNKQIDTFIDENIKSATTAWKNVYSVLTGIDVIEKSELNSDLLFLATRAGKIEILKSLLEKGADINYVEGHYYMFSPSLEAVSKDRDDLLNLFIANGLNVNSIYSSDDLTLLNCAIEYNSEKCFNILLQKCDLGHFVTQSPMSCALEAASKGNRVYYDRLKERVDSVVEEIESVQYSIVCQPGFDFANFVYSGDQRKVDFLNFGGIKSNPDFPVISLFIKSDIVQKSVAVHTSYRGEYTNSSLMPSSIIEQANLDSNFSKKQKKKSSYYY